MARSPYGKRGGTSVNAGRKQSTYEGKAPDGSILHVRSFLVSADKAWMHISCQGGACWYGNAVRLQPEDWSGPPNSPIKQMWVECVKVK